MKAIVQRGYGGADVLRLEDIDMPLVADDAVLVRVHAAAANPYDWHLMRGVPYLARLEMGLRRPKNTIAGADMAGMVCFLASDQAAYITGTLIDVSGGKLATQSPQAAYVANASL